MTKFAVLTSILLLSDCAAWRAPLVVEQEVQLDDSVFRRLRNAEIAIGELQATQQMMLNAAPQLRRKR